MYSIAITSANKLIIPLIITLIIGNYSFHYLDGLYRARRRKVHGFCQPDRPTTEQVARGSRPGQRNGVHHTASVLGVTEEEGTIRGAVPRGIRTMRGGCEEDTCVALTGSTVLCRAVQASCPDGYVGEPTPERAASAEAWDQGISN